MSCFEFVADHREHRSDASRHRDADAGRSLIGQNTRRCLGVHMEFRWLSKSRLSRLHPKQAGVLDLSLQKTTVFWHQISKKRVF